MVHLILDTNFGFWALQLLFFKMVINLIIYIEISMGIFVIYICIIRPLPHFDYTNFKVSLIVKIITFNGIKNMAHLATCHLPCECDYLSKFQFIKHLLHLC